MHAAANSAFSSLLRFIPPPKLLVVRLRIAAATRTDLQ
jgi:hypothetical protein